jgi:hypothetical protein
VVKPTDKSNGRREGRGRGTKGFSLESKHESANVLTKDDQTSNDDMYISANINREQIYFPIKLKINKQIVEIKAMIDCGASSLFFSSRIVQQNDLPTQKLLRPLRLHNVDQTLNKSGRIT